MFKNLFNRTKITPATSLTPAVQVSPRTETPEPSPVAPKESRLDAFREAWDDTQDSSPEVIEGNGSNTDWAAFNDAVEGAEKSFAPTVPMPLSQQ